MIMKKIFLFGGVVAALMGLASCDDSFDDWASLKTADAPTASAAYGLTFTGSGTDIDMNAENLPDSIDLVTVASTDTMVSNFIVKNVTLNGGKIAYRLVDGKTARVSVKDLDEAAKQQLKSQKYEQRKLNVDVTTAAVLKNGTAVQVLGSVVQNETPLKTPDVDANGYFILGDGANGWDPTKPLMMKETAEGSHIYKATMTTTGNTNWFKFYGASSYHGASTSWADVNAVQYGCATDGDAATFNYVTWGDAVKAPTIEGAGTWIVTFDANTWTYSISKPVLYMAGDANGWKQTEMLASTDGNYYKGFMYLNNNGFKFSTETNWDGTNYGAGFSTAKDAANMSLPDGYTEGYYQVELDLAAKKMTLTAITTIGIIGDATASGWDASTPMTYDKDSHTWVLKDATLKAGDLKFRANDGWDINWGGSTDNLVQNGANLKIDEAGKYFIQFFPNCETKSYCTITKK